MERVKLIIKFLLDIVYPNRCPCCNKIIVWNEHVCEECIETFIPATINPENYDNYKKSETYENAENSITSENTITLYKYEGKAKKGITSLKFGKYRNFGYFCGEKLAERIISADIKADIIVAVPLDKEHSKIGKNHAEILAKQIADITKIPLRTDILTKTNGAPEQKTLKAKERFLHLHHFQINPISLENKIIILVDDIITTGATMQRCRELLLSQGAVGVYFVSATKT
jgi:competence protein ComFC